MNFLIGWIVFRSWHIWMILLPIRHPIRCSSLTRLPWRCSNIFSRKSIFCLIPANPSVNGACIWLFRFFLCRSCFHSWKIFLSKSRFLCAALASFFLFFPFPSFPSFITLYILILLSVFSQAAASQCRCFLRKKTFYIPCMYPLFAQCSYWPKMPVYSLRVLLLYWISL